MELAISPATGAGRRLIMTAITHVFTISRVVQMLGEDEDWLYEISAEMDPEDGCVTVYGVGDESIAAFTPFGVENLTELVKMHKAPTRTYCGETRAPTDHSAAIGISAVLTGGLRHPRLSAR